MYPGYTVQSALDEYAIRFFSLLNEGYRNKHRHYRILAQIAILPHLKKEDMSRFLSGLDWAGKDPSDIMENRNAEPMSSEELRKMLGSI